MASLEIMKLFYQTALFALLFSCTSFSVVAQTTEVFPTLQPSQFVDAKPMHCWYNELRLTGLTQYTPRDKTFIVISRLGDKDSKPEFNKRRLHNIRTYWTQHIPESDRRDPQKIILAEGEPTSGYGQVEFYLDGRLVEVLKARPNGDLGVADCYAGVDGEPPCAEEWQKLFYPCKGFVEKQKQKRKVVPKKRKFHYNVPSNKSLH